MLKRTAEQTGVWCTTPEGGSIFVLCDPGQTSDGYHTINELYRHRNLLFVALMQAYPELSWFSNYNADGTSHPGYFVAGIRLATGGITYHLPIALRPMVSQFASELQLGEWDGHSPEDVCTRIGEWVEG